MIIYEVNLTISNTIYKDFQKWLNVHIEKMLTFKGFNKYKIYNVSSDDVDSKLLCVHYYIQTMNDLNNYFKNYSEIMKKECLDKFGNNFNASRRILSL
jgi:hypothetical protein